jgi:hypothetical protein
VKRPPNDTKTNVARLMSDEFAQFARNGRWGTCGHCPRDSSGGAYPEFCDEFERSDHQLELAGLVRLFDLRVRQQS